MSEHTSHASFVETVEEIDVLREQLDGMLQPEEGWEWAHRPKAGKGKFGSMSYGAGIVCSEEVVSRRRGSDSEPGQPCVKVFIAQGGGGDEPCRQHRPVAFDGNGTRFAFKGGSSVGGSRNPSGNWTRMSSFELPADLLAPQNVAFFGVEVEKLHGDNIQE